VSGPAMQPVLAAAKRNKRRVIFAEGEDDRVLRAVQVLVDENLVEPVLIGREPVIRARIQDLDLRLDVETEVEIVHGQSHHLHGEIETEYFEHMKRRGITVAMAREHMRTQQTAIAAMYLRRGYVDAMICGMRGTYDEHLGHISNLIGPRAGVTTLAAMNMLMLHDRRLFICDTYVNRDPNAEQIVEITLMAAREVRRFGIVPSVALLSHSNFGSSNDAEAVKMRTAARMLAELAPDLEVDGEMRGDAALLHTVLNDQLPDARLQHDANLLVMPGIGAANIAYNLLRVAASNNITVGPMLLGTAKPAHIVEPGATARRIVNMTALAAVEAAGS